MAAIVAFEADLFDGLLDPLFVGSHGLVSRYSGPFQRRLLDRRLVVDGPAIDFVLVSDRAQLGESSSGCGTDDCGRTSATSRPSTMPSPLSIRLSGSAGRRSSAFVRERHAPIDATSPPNRQMIEETISMKGGAERPRARCGRRSRVDGDATRTTGRRLCHRHRTRAADRQKALDFGAQEFVGLDNDALDDVGEVDLVFDVIGGDIGKRSAGLIRAGGTLVTIVGPTGTRPADGLAIDVSDPAQLGEIVQQVRDGRLRTNIGNVSTLDDAVAAFKQTKRRAGKTVIRVRP